MTNNPTIDGVSRYGHIGYLVKASPRLLELYPDMTVYVKASDYDALAEEVAALQSTIAQLQARVGEPETGVGDHPECSGNHESCPENEGFGCCMTSSGSACPGDGVNACRKCPQLYTAPPAPVAVVLPERLKPEHWMSHDWNACLDATAALNKGRK